MIRILIGTVLLFIGARMLFVDNNLDGGLVWPAVGMALLVSGIKAKFSN